MCKLRLLFALVLVCVLGLAENARVEDGNGLQKIFWNGTSREYPTIQSAIDALADGGKLEIAAGVFEIAERVLIRKKVLLQGAGSGRNTRRPVTHLLGPPPRPIVDKDGRLILRWDEVVGLLTSVGGDVTVKSMKISGFDAAIVAKDGRAGEVATTRVEDCTITKTGRGILSLSSGLTTVADCVITDTSWNGISVAPKNFILHGVGLGLIITASNFANQWGVGIYLSNTYAVINDAHINNAQAGGIAGYRSKALITNSNLFNNKHSGIAFHESNEVPLFYNTIKDNLIVNTHPDHNGNFGDGIVLAVSNGELIDNYISSPARVGVSNFGSHVRLTDMNIFCATIHLAGNPMLGQDWSFEDLGGNLCGCGTLDPCASKSVVLEPPEPIGGLE